MSNKYPPILDIPVSQSFRNLTETRVELLFDTPVEKPGKFGPQFMYRVNVEGEEHTLFASPALHRQMQEHKPGKGTVLSIARVGQGKETKWDVVYVSGQQGEASNEPRSSGESKPAASRGPDVAGFKRDQEAYWNAFRYAHAQLAESGIDVSVDLNAVAFVFYRMAKDHGIEDPANPGAATTPTTTTAAVEKEQRQKMRAELERLFRATGLHESDWLTVVNAHTREGQEVTTWGEVTRDVGLAVYATAKNVESGISKWSDFGVSAEENDDDQEELPF